MINQRWKWILFGTMVIAQWWLTIGMTSRHEKVLTEGAEYRFQVAPLDPDDPLRGKYMQLEFADREVPIDTTLKWDASQPVLVTVFLDAQGFASPLKIENYNFISRDTEIIQSNQFKTKINYIDRARQVAILDYPFDRFYLNEFLAPAAERIYREAAQDSSKVSYAKVFVHDGNAVLQDVLINNVSLVQLAEWGNNFKSRVEGS